MKHFFLSCIVLCYALTAWSQLAFTSGPSFCTSSGVLCAGSSCTNPNFASDGDINSFATLTTAAGLLCSNTLTSDFTALQASGRWTGFFISGTDLLSLIPSVTLTVTNTTNTQTQSITGIGLITLLSSGQAFVQFQSGIAFDRIELALGGIADVGQSMNVYFGFSSPVMRSAALPVTWVSFLATAVDRRVELVWLTGFESNSSYFEIERSTDGTVFRPIGRVAAAGSSQQNRTYRFNDEAPVKGADNYYRLKQVDRDHANIYSAIVRVRVNASNQFSVQVVAQQGGSVQVLAEGLQNNEKIFIEILDGNGRSLYREQAIITGSVFSKTITGQYRSKGIYFYRLTRLASGESLRGRFFLTM